MTILVIADEATRSRAERALAALGGAQAGAELLAGEPADSGGRSAAQRLAAALVAHERTMRERAATAVLLAGESDSVLAAAIAATKLQIPTAFMGEDEGSAPEGPRARLLELIADTTLAVEAGAIVAWATEAGGRSAHRP